jgi:hypothetical protein
MGRVMADIGAIGKTENNTAQRFKFRGIDNVYNALHGIMAKHGVFCTSEILEKSREERPSKSGGVMAFTCLRMRYRFHAPDGSYVTTEVEGEGMDSGDKSSNKAMAIAHKYALLQAFLIPTEEQKDPDAESPEIGGELTVTAETKGKLDRLLLDAGLTDDEIDEYRKSLRLASWDDLTEERAQRIISKMESKLSREYAEGEAAADANDKRTK